MPLVLEAKCGAGGRVRKPPVVRDPGYPAPNEKHGFLLWADEAELRAIKKKLHNVEPFKTSYRIFRGKWYQNINWKFVDRRHGWRATASQAGRSLANAFTVAIEGAKGAAKEAPPPALHGAP